MDKINYIVSDVDHNDAHCSQVKILLNTDSTSDANEADPNTTLATFDGFRSDYECQPIFEGEINDMADVVQAYKCRKCCFTVQDKQLLIDHYKTEHTEISATKVKVLFNFC